MQVRIKYSIEHDEIIDISPEEYCHLLVDNEYGCYFPENASCRIMYTANDKSRAELIRFLYDKDIARHNKT